MRTIASGADGRVNQNWPTVYPLKTHGADAADGANARSARRSVFSGIRCSERAMSHVAAVLLAWEGVSKVAREMDRTFDHDASHRTWYLMWPALAGSVESDCRVLDGS